MFRATPKTAIFMILAVLGGSMIACGKDDKPNKKFLGLFAKDPANYREGFCGKVYDLSTTQPETLPDWNQLTSIDDFEAKMLNFPDRDASASYPGLNPAWQQWYGIHFKGRMTISEAGEYEFCEQSSDNFRFTLSDVISKAEIFNLQDDTIHLPQTVCKKVFLNEGIYRYSLEYMQTDNERIALHFTYQKDGQGGHAPVCTHGTIYTESDCPEVK